MKKFLRILGYLLSGIIILLAALLTYIKVALPNVGPAPELSFKYTPERIERGKYLANHVTVCMDCHSRRDWSKFSGPLDTTTLGMGGERFDQTVGFPGVYYSRNITPVGISRYTDGELFRVITTGVTKEGRAMFPIMPYGHYAKMDPEDIMSIIAYVRSLAPIQHQVPDPKSDFPMNFIINTIPEKASPQSIPQNKSDLAYGAYMTNASGCIECHTQVDKGRIIPEMSFAGGREFKLPDGSIVRSANLTSDMKTGIGSWSEELFIQKFKSFADSSYKLPKAQPGVFNSYMPWNMYCRMTTEDLSAIYKFLKSQKNISNPVVKFTSSH